MLEPSDIQAVQQPSDEDMNRQYAAQRKKQLLEHHLDRMWDTLRRFQHGDPRRGSLFLQFMTLAKQHNFIEDAEFEVSDVHS